MQLQKEHISWKMLPAGEKLIPQFVCQINNGRLRFTENPENPADELLSSIPVDSPYSMLLLPPCSIETITAAQKMVPKVLIVDYNQERLDDFNKYYPGEFDSLSVSDELDFRAQISAYSEHLSFGKVVSFIPSRYAKLDKHINYLLSDKLLEVQKEFCSFAVNRTLKRWHRNLNTIENIKNSKSLVLKLPNLRKQDAVIVGAGPSLDKTVVKLKACQNNVIIIATDGSLRTLLNNKVKPDFIVSCEDTLMSWQFFVDHLDQLEGIPLVASYNANHYLLKNYPGNICLVRDSNIEKWASDILKLLPNIDTGRCVGHLAFNLALYLNAGRIIMTGFDLAFKDDVFHPVDMPVPYFHEMDVPVPVLVKSIYGTMLKTDLSMVSYLKDFEYMISVSQVEVIDATEGGAVKKGTQIQNFEDVSFRELKYLESTEPTRVSFYEAFNGLVENNETFKKQLTESFTSYLVQNSSSVLFEHKEDDLKTASELVARLLEQRKPATGKALVLQEDSQNKAEYANYDFFQDVAVIYYNSLSDLLQKIREDEIEHVYCIDGQIPPDLMALYDLKCTDFKTSTLKLSNERVLWLKKYEIICHRENYDFWRKSTPAQVNVTVKEHISRLKVS